MALAIALCVASIGLPALTASAAPASYVVDKKIASDNLNRSVANGWGSAQIGGTYKLSRASTFSGNGTAGIVSVPNPGMSQTATLSSASARDSVASIVVIFPRVPKTGNGIFAGLQLRSAGGSYYQAQLREGSSKNLTLSLLRVNGSTANQTTLVGEKVVGRNLAAGARINLEFQATGSDAVSLDARAWLDGAVRPEWQVSTTDSSPKRVEQSGALGVWTYVSSATAPQPISYDDIAEYALKPLPASTVTPTPVVSTPTASPTTTPMPSTTPTPPPTTPPTPPTTTQPGSAQDPAIDMTGTRQSAGAGVIGTARYAVPAGAIFVAPAGSDGASGTLANPYATVQHAIDVAPSGATIVLRAGSYHESVTIPATKQLVMQSYPGEAAWFDGSVPVTNWKRSGSVWAATGWNHVFDSSPTFTKGASDGTTDGWQWLNPAYPMAAHPDQIWVDGVAQQQVSNLGQVGTGRFYYDTAAHTLYLGTDPSAGNVRASDLQKAISIQGPNVVLRGFGVHRYAPSVPDMGAVTSWKGGATFENMAFNDNATTGLSIGGSGVTLRNVTAARNGLLGVQADKTDSLSVTGLLASGNDAERFNTSPVSGGLKVTRARGVQVSDSAFVRNFGQGLWMDESVYNMTFVNNDMIGNVGNGTVVEISANLVFANNLSTGNGGAGVKINDVSNVSVWNNTLTNNNRNINITQDSRRASNPSDFGHDPRQAFPDPTMTWVNKSIAIHNNVISGGNGNCLLCVEDYSHQYSAAQMQISSDGNVYQRPSANAPTWAVIWSRGAGDPAVYNTFALFTAATGQDAHSLVFDTAAGVNGTAPSAQVNSAQKSVAQPLPATVAVLVHQSQGTLHLGAW